jgi:hypothetical protein
MMEGVEQTASSAWFGADFACLHPRLQELHLQGGVLCGTVQITFGQGLAGVIGRRIARKLGIPTTGTDHQLQVLIAHHGQVLHWDRRFDDAQQFPSTFRPVGHWPDGHWIEETSAISLRLQVDIIDGGWHWRCIGARHGRWRVPAWVLPRSEAFKQIEEDCYRFSVSFTLPLLGEVLRYGGLLNAHPD